MPQSSFKSCAFQYFWYNCLEFVEMEMVSLKLVVLLFIWIVLCNNCIAIEVQFERVEMRNATFLESFFNITTLRISKLNRTAYALNLDFELFRDYGEETSAEIELYYNRLNNNQYNKTPFRIPKQSICDLGKTYYKELVMKQLEDTSNLPVLGANDEFCPLKKVEQYKFFPMIFFQ